MIRHRSAVVVLVTWNEFTFCHRGDVKNDFFTDILKPVYRNLHLKIISKIHGKFQKYMYY